MNNSAIATLISVEADSQSNLPSRLHLLRAGTFDTEKYGKLEITADDLKEFADNFNAGYARKGLANEKGGLPVNFGHEKGGAAAAWINGLEADGNDLWGTKVEWSTKGKAAVEGSEYKYLSSEFTPRCLGGMYTDPENVLQRARNVFTGAALTNIPMFTGNKQVMASAESTGSDKDKQVIYINAQAKENRSMPTLDEVRVKDVASLTDEDKKVLADNKTDLSADELKKFGMVEASAGTAVSIEAAATSEGVVTVEASAVKAMFDENVELKKKVEAANATKTDLEKKVEAHEEQLAASKLKSIEAAVETHVKRGAIKSDDAKKWVDRAMKDESLLDDMNGMQANPVLATEQGSTGDNDALSATEALNKAVEAAMKEDEKLNYADATKKVLASDEALSKKLNEERKGAVA